MYILLTFIFILIIGIIVGKISHNRDEEVITLFSILCCIISSLVIIGMTISIIDSQYDKKVLYRHKILQDQYNQSRRDAYNSIERASITKDIVDYNMWLASEKYDNDHQWDWWVSDRVAALPYIK